MDDLSGDVDFVLARGAHRQKLAEKRPDLVVVRSFPIRGERELLLLQRWGRFVRMRARNRENETAAVNARAVFCGAANGRAAPLVKNFTKCLLSFFSQSQAPTHPPEFALCRFFHPPLFFPARA